MQGEEDKNNFVGMNGEVTISSVLECRAWLYQSRRGGEKAGRAQGNNL